MFPAEVGKRLVEVSAFHPKPGGAPANVAVCLARLEARSAFIGKVGDDAFGHYLAAVLAQEGVETRAMRFDDYARTTMAFIASPDPNTAEFLFYRNPGADTRLQAGELDRKLLAESKALHMGSLSLVEEPIRSAAVEAIHLCKAAGGMISLDVNYRPTLWSGPEAAYEQVMAILPEVDLVKVNEDELFLLTGTRDLDSGSSRILQRGPSICAVTLGARGSFFRTSLGLGRVAPFEIETVDATGAGDAFISGLLKRLVTGDEWCSQCDPPTMRRNLLYANAVGAITAQTQGAIPALPKASAVEEFLNQQPEWRAANA
jgi:fructokinase